MVGFATTNKHSQARYYVFEGPNGVGKTTQIQLLYDYLKKQFSPDQIIRTGEPWYDGSKGDLIKQTLQGRGHHLSAQEFFYAVVANRQDHLSRVVVPALEQGKIVLQRRGPLSTFAYQSVQGVYLPEMIKAHQGMEAPDITYILHASVDTCLERLRQRHAQTNHRADQFENATTLKRVLDDFMELWRYFPGEGIAYIPATGKPAEIHEEIKSHLPKDLAQLLQA